MKLLSIEYIPGVEFEALVALGYSASEAAGAVRKLQVTEEMSVEDILKLSLKNL